MTGIVNKLQALETQRQAIVQACIDCGYDVSENATLYEAFQVLNTVTEAGIVMVSANTPIGKLQKLHLAYVQLVNYAFDAQLATSATFTQIAEAIMPMQTEAYALLLQNSSYNYDLVFTRGCGFSAGGTYKGKTIYKAFAGIEENEITTVNSIPWYSYRTYIYHVRFDDTVRPPNLMFFFWGLTNCLSIDLDGLDASASTTLNRTFTNCSKITEIDLSVIEMGNVLETSYMFNGCTLLERITFGDLDTTNTTAMDRMFGGCSSLRALDLSWMSTQNLTNCSFMFYGCTNLAELNLDGWDLDGISTYQSMYWGCNALEELDLSTLGNIYINNYNVFFGSIPNLKTIYAAAGTVWSSRYPSASFFENCDSLVGGAGTAFVSGQTNNVSYARIDGYGNQPGYFTEKRDFSGNAYAVAIPDSGGTKYELHFLRANTAPVAGETYAGKTIAYVYSGFEGTNYTSNSQLPWYSQHDNFTSVIFDGWVKPVTLAYWFYMFRYCTTFDVAKLDTSQIASIAYAFYYCSAVADLDLRAFAGCNPSNAKYCFYYCTGITGLNVSGWNMAATTDFTECFRGCSNLLQITGLDTWHVSNACNKTAHMFNGCAKLTSLILGVWDLSNVTDASYMFQRLNKATVIDMSDCTFGTSLTTIAYMFNSCGLLTTIYAKPGTDISYAATRGSVFYNCYSLIGGNGSGLNNSTSLNSALTNGDYACIDGLDGKQGYFTAKVNV